MASHRDRGRELVQLVQRAQDGWSDRFAGVQVRRPLWRDSSDLTPDHWRRIAGAVRALVGRHGATAVLVAHGTDTMAHTAAALSFLCLDIDVPICLTGASSPLGQPGSDAVDNVEHAVVALRRLRPGVYISFAGAAGRPSRVHLGCCARKVSGAESVFVSVNRSPIATVRGDEVRMLEREPDRFPVPAHPRVEPRVLSFGLHPGLDLNALLAAVDAAGAAGVVVERYPSGAAPARGPASLPRFAAALHRRGVTCVALRERPRPPGAPDYPLVTELREEGAIVLDGLGREAMTAKLMWALAQDWDQDRLREVLSWSLCGERVAAGGDS